MTTKVDRQQVLAYRAFAQGLHRNTESVVDLSVLDLGVQDTPAGSADHALATRLRSPSSDLSSSPGLTTTWSLRGAPHVHRHDDLVALARALWPWSDDDALARLDTSASPVRATGMEPRQALRFVAEQMADIVTHPMPKGDVSTALTPRIPAEMTVDCRRCKATHIVETLFRSSVLPAGITFDPNERVVTFVPVPGWPGVPRKTTGVARVVTDYLRLLGPAAPGDAAGFLGTKTSELRTKWPTGLAEVELDGTTRGIPEDAIDTLTAAPDPPGMRLLPPSDPWLQARDRDLIVPDRSHHEVMWPILGRPGAVLARGEVAGAWRARKKGRRLDVSVEPFRRLNAAQRRGIDDEAALLAQVRGVADASVTIE